MLAGTPSQTGSEITGSTVNVTLPSFFPIPLSEKEVQLPFWPVVHVPSVPVDQSQVTFAPSTGSPPASTIMVMLAVQVLPWLVLPPSARPTTLTALEESLTVMLTVAVFPSSKPSFALKVKLSGPLKSKFGA